MGAALSKTAWSRTTLRVYLDANVFIAAFEHVGAHSDHAWWIFQAIEAGEIAGATSELTLAEVLVKPLERDAADLAEGYENMIVSGSHFEAFCLCGATSSPARPACGRGAHRPGFPKRCISRPRRL